MEICILSMQRVQNFGSLLQSYALKRTLEQLGHSVEFLDIEPCQEDNILLGDAKNEFTNEGEPSGTLLSKLKKIDKYTLNRLRIKYRSVLQNKKFQQFRTEVLGIVEHNDRRRFDYCIIGSDEVFNCLSGASWGFTSQLFGNVDCADSIITYAASCGATVYENVPEKVQTRIREAFARISAFSVRDDNTYSFVSQLTEKSIEKHLDPVLIHDFSNEINQAKLPDDLPSRYCIIYSYYNRFNEQRDIEQILEFCKENRLEPVTVGAPQKWIKNHLVLDPFVMLKVFQKAEFVITDTFHGTIFAAKYAKRFAVLVRSSNRNKLLDLIKSLHLERHLVPALIDLEKLDAYEVASPGIKGILLTEREKTNKYLMEFVKVQ